MQKQNASKLLVAQFIARGGTIVVCKPAKARNARVTAQRSKHCGKPTYMRSKRRA
jgi:hypothetical protein